MSPVTIPVEAPIVALVVLLLLHVPEPVGSVNVMGFSDASHTDADPTMADGLGFTVMA